MTKCTFKKANNVGDELVGADEDGELYKGIVSFMIIGLTQNIPYVFKALPETKIRGEWLMEELWNCFNILHGNRFRVRGVVCDNHSSNVSAYMKLLAHYGQNDKDLFINFKESNIYLFFDTVHLIKNIRNNLLNNKIFKFPTFIFQGLYNDVKVTGGEIS